MTVVSCNVLWGSGAVNEDGTCNGPSYLNFVLMFFFGLWNFGCSPLILVPLLRICHFGIRDADAKRAMMTLICPHWLVGIVMPFLIGGLFSSSVGTILPYLFNGYRINKFCREERRNGRIIEVKEEVDIFIDGKKTMRISKIRMSDDRLMFACYGKRYGTRIKKSVEFMLSPTQLYISNELMGLFSGRITRAVSFVDMREQNIKLLLTELTGMEGGDVMKAPQLPKRQDSIGRTLIKMASADYHFTSVARPVPSTPTVTAYSGFVPAIIPSQPTIAIAAAIPPDSEAGDINPMTNV